MRTKCYEMQKSREKFSNKVTNNEGDAYKKLVESFKGLELRQLGEFQFNVKCKWENQN
jgi:hypothetical protein